MFCDMVDFTELSGKVGSEDAYSFRMERLAESGTTYVTQETFQY
jgi:class 3 adenylate cyclase